MFKAKATIHAVYMDAKLDIMADLEAITQMAARLAIDNQENITVPSDRVVG